MKCHNIKRKISTYIDGELKENQKHIIELHLKTCQSCREIYDNLTQSWELLTIAPEPEKIPHFYTRLKVRMVSRESRVELSWKKRILLPVTATAVMIMGMIMGSFVAMNGEVSNGLQSEDILNNTYYLDTFDDFPTASMGEVYFELASYE